jgi:hypothetical protein
MTEEQPSPAPAAPPPPDPRRRLRELLTIPERDRTDAQWDEIIELEIQLAPGNRVGPAPSGGGGGGGSNRQGAAPGGQKPTQSKKNRPRWGSGRQHQPKK